MYFPTLQPRSTNVVIRTTTDPMSIVGGVRNVVHDMDPDQPIARVQPMTTWVDASVSTQRYRTTLLALFAALAMVLAATGIYGVMSYTVAQRTHEIGVRMALGARRHDVLKLVVRQGMTLALAGVVVGFIAAFALTHLMSSMLFGVSARDPITLVMLTLLLAAVALLANLVPARRAAMVEPMVALRCD